VLIGLSIFVVVTIMYPLWAIWSRWIVKITELPKKRAGEHSPYYSLAKLAFHVVLMYLAFQLYEWSFSQGRHG